MGNVGAEITRTAKCNLSVHISAVHVDLSAALMDDIANFHHLLFEYAIRGWVSNHHARELIFIFVRLERKIKTEWLSGMKVKITIRYLGFQLSQIDASCFVRVDWLDSHAGHLCGGRIRAVSRHGNKANVALTLAD